MITHSVVQRVWFIDAMLKGNGGVWPDLEELVAAIYSAHLRPGDVALDIGVNHGLHLVRMAELVGAGGAVVGVEAVPAFAAHARARLDAAGDDLAARVVVHECAVGAAPGRADFFVTGITDGGLSGLRLRPVIAVDAYETIAVEVRTLDALLPARRVRFVKIDIEGGEYDALRGAPGLLAQQPLIAFEFNDSAPAEFGYHVDALRALLADAGYRIHDIFGFPVDSGAAMTAARVWNFVAVPPGLDPDAVTAPARAILAARDPALAGFAPTPPPPPELVAEIVRAGGLDGSMTPPMIARALFVDALLAANGNVWPDLEPLVAAIYAGYVRRGDLVLDVGVNHGLHLIELARLVGPDGLVVGVEAVPALADHVEDLLAGARGDLRDRVVLHRCAVAAEPGTTDFFVTSIADGGMSGLRLRPVIAGEAVDRIRVEARTLDALLPPDRAVRFAKIDIEGGEYDALRGAPRLIAQRPLIAFEFDPSAPEQFGYHVDDLLGLLRGAGYAVHDIFGFEVDSGAAMLAARVWNFLAIPPGVDPDTLTAPARAILEARHPALAALAPHTQTDAAARGPILGFEGEDAWLSPFGGTWIDRHDWREEIARRPFSSQLAADLRDFAENGFVVLESAADPAAIDRFQAAISAAFRDGNPGVLCQRPGASGGTIALTEPIDRLGARVVDAFVPLPAALDLLATPRLIAFLAALFDEPPLLFQSLSFDQGSQQGMHKDTAYVVVDRPHELAACWIALEDIAEGSGELIYAPGSHRDPAFAFGVGRSYWRPDLDGDAAHERWAREIRDNAARHGVERFAARRGDILVWHAELAHGGGEIRDRTLTRQSLVGHFCPRSARPRYFDTPPHRPTVRDHGELAYASAHYDLAPASAPLDPV